MIRARFKVNPDDPHPVSWPIQHPYWVTGGSDEYSIVVAYADDEAAVLRLWPDATDLDAVEAVGYSFTDRFPRPKWWNAAQGERG